MRKPPDDSNFWKHFVKLKEMRSAFVSVSVTASNFADQELP
jgi:hypothetical protein